MSNTDIITDAIEAPVEIGLLREWLDKAEEVGDTVDLHRPASPGSTICYFCDQQLPCYVLRSVAVLDDYYAPRPAPCPDCGSDCAASGETT